ncbi:MAG: DNA cytosine methyltransferase [Synergistaceae bacterium]|nr:DNA cytosine methyltransferase [Synergistaceae bacterium]
MINAISLFTGAGGMDVGFENAGANILLANEIDKKAAETYMANHPNTNMMVDDINNIWENLEIYKDVDIVFGGPPCQGFSVIGKMDPEDERSQLIWSFLHAVEILQPHVFVMENVKALAAISKWSNVKNDFIAKAEEMGYGCVPFIINAAEYGTPQKRERVFLLVLSGIIILQRRCKS